MLPGNITNISNNIQYNYCYTINIIFTTFVSLLRMKIPRFLLFS